MLSVICPRGPSLREALPRGGRCAHRRHAFFWSYPILIPELINLIRRMHRQHSSPIRQLLHPFDPTTPPTMPIRRHPLFLQHLPIQRPQNHVEYLRKPLRYLLTDETRQVGVAEESAALLLLLLLLLLYESSLSSAGKTGSN